MYCNDSYLEMSADCHGYFCDYSYTFVGGPHRKQISTIPKPVTGFIHKFHNKGAVYREYGTPKPTLRSRVCLSAREDCWDITRVLVWARVVSLGLCLICP